MNISESGSHGRKKLEPEPDPLETNADPEADLFHNDILLSRPGSRSYRIIVNFRLHHPHPYNSLYFWHTMRRDHAFSLTQLINKFSYFTAKQF
jgi:hypothetical protein